MGDLGLRCQLVIWDIIQWIIKAIAVVSLYIWTICSGCYLAVLVCVRFEKGEWALLTPGGRFPQLAAHEETFFFCVIISWVAFCCYQFVKAVKNKKV